MIRRCPQCGSTTDDVYGFCYKCGREFSEMEVGDTICPTCNFKNPDEADYCVKCGTPLIFKNNGTDKQIQPIIIKRQVIGDNTESYNKTSSWVIILGYIFSILGGIIGLIIAIYLSTRKDPVARKHGHIQLIIFALYIIILAILLLTGNFPFEAYEPYRQMMQGNLTSLKL